jgi:hypothetical protein
MHLVEDEVRKNFSFLFLLKITMKYAVYSLQRNFMSINAFRQLTITPRLYFQFDWLNIFAGCW